MPASVVTKASLANKDDSPQAKAPTVRSWSKRIKGTGQKNERVQGKRRKGAEGLRTEIRKEGIKIKHRKNEEMKEERKERSVCGVLLTREQRTSKEDEPRTYVVGAGKTGGYRK